MYSEIQNKVIDQLDRSADIRSIEDFTAHRDENSPAETVVEITTFDGGEFYFRYNVWPDGETELHRFKLEESKLIQYDERFSMFRDKEKTSGDEPFDVVVKNEIEKERIMARFNFDELAHEVMASAFEDYVRDHKQTLVEYAEDSAKERLTEHVNDNVDFEELAMNTIDDMLDSYIDYDMPDIGDAAEDIISRYIFD